MKILKKSRNGNFPENCLGKLFLPISTAKILFPDVDANISNQKRTSFWSYKLTAFPVLLWEYKETKMSVIVPLLSLGKENQTNATTNLPLYDFVFIYKDEKRTVSSCSEQQFFEMFKMVIYDKNNNPI